MTTKCFFRNPFHIKLGDYSLKSTKDVNLANYVCIVLNLKYDDVSVHEISKCNI